MIFFRESPCSVVELSGWLLLEYIFMVRAWYPDNMDSSLWSPQTWEQLPTSVILPLPCGCQVRTCHYRHCILHLLYAPLPLSDLPAFSHTKFLASYAFDLCLSVTNFVFFSFFWIYLSSLTSRLYILWHSTTFRCIDVFSRHCSSFLLITGKRTYVV